MSENIDYSPTSNVARMHAAAARESSEPVAKTTPVSLSAVVGIIIFAIIAGSYFGSNGGSVFGRANIKGYNYEPQLGDIPIIPTELTEEEQHQKENWLASGKGKFATCVACHKDSGEGQPGQFPPLKNSEFVIKGEKRLTAILLHGINGSLTVNGVPFSGVMQPLGGAASMTHKDLAQLLSYIRNSWGNSASMIYEDQIEALRKELGNRSFYTETELRKMSDSENAPPSRWPALLEKAAAPAAAPGTAPAPGAAPAGTTPPAPGTPAEAPPAK